MDQCLANPSPSMILISEEESRDLGKLTSTVVSRRPKKNNADQLLCFYESTKIIIGACPSFPNGLYILGAQYGNHQKGFSICVLNCPIFLPVKQKFRT